MATKEHDKFEIVVALDIGTTYSGYAFQTTEAFKENPLNIQYTQSWNAGRKRMVSHKTPTCLLVLYKESFLHLEVVISMLITAKIHTSLLHNFILKRWK
jgi:hypothetical protein